MERIEQEKTVVKQMITIYCHRHHSTHGDDICDECDKLLHYALHRLDHCPKGNDKSSCRICEIHCYSPENRNRIRAVMKYVGPRMIFYHPRSAIRHLLTEMRGNRK